MHIDSWNEKKEEVNELREEIMILAVLLANLRVELPYGMQHYNILDYRERWEMLEKIRELGVFDEGEKQDEN